MEDQAESLIFKMIDFTLFYFICYLEDLENLDIFHVNFVDRMKKNLLTLHDQLKTMIEVHCQTNGKIYDQIV